MNKEEEEHVTAERRRIPMAKILNIEYRATGSTSVTFDNDHYPNMSLEEAIAFEKGADPYDVLDMIGSLADKGTLALSINVSVLDTDNREGLDD